MLQLALGFNECKMVLTQTSINKASNRMPTQKLTPEIITAAIEGFEAQKVRLDTQIADLRQMLDGGSPEAAATKETRPGQRKVSAAARRRMALGQKKRWA